MKSRIARGSLVAVCVLSIAGCNIVNKLLHKGDDAGATASTDDGSTASTTTAAADGAATTATTPPAPPAVNAANIAEIMRYPDEVAANNETLTVMWRVADVNTAAGTGKLIGDLKQTTSVHKVSSHDVFFLVVYPDPSDAVVTLTGWVNQRVFSQIDTDAGKVHLNCSGTAGIGGKPTVAFEGENSEYCEVRCTVDSNCPDEYLCKGDAPLASNGALASYCTAPPVIVDSGIPVAVVDASVAAIDASVAAIDASVATAADAGAPACKGQAILTGPLRGICPTGYHINGGRCQLVCGSAADCCFSPGATCKPFGGSNVCFPKGT